MKDEWQRRTIDPSRSQDGGMRMHETNLRTSFRFPPASFLILLLDDIAPAEVPFGPREGRAGASEPG